VECELDKFDAMMRLLHRRVYGFSQVVAVDRQFSLFTRAWCVAELVEADTCNMPQRVYVSSQKALERNQATLANVRVEECKASRQEDVQMILSKIELANDSIENFNCKLRDIIASADSIFRHVDVSNMNRTLGDTLTQLV